MKRQRPPIPLWAGVCAGIVVALSAAVLHPSIAAAQPPGPPMPAGPCGALQMADFSAIPDAPTTIFSTQIVSATTDQPEYCDVLGMISSQIQFELWLPTTTWNNRYLQVGCGGYCGSLDSSEQCTVGLGMNFAVGWDNSGHVGGSPMSGGDALWAYDNQRLREDFGYRSEHVMAVAAKTIIASFYGEDPAYSYFQGCSNGGRQALQEAQRWPEDFNGIIAGAPAAIQAPLNGEYETWNGRANQDAQGNPILTTADLTLINDAALANCDGLDGLVDGQITDPRRCTFEPATLVCTGEEAMTAPADNTLPVLPAAAPAGTITATLPLTAATSAMAALPGAMTATATVTPTCLTETQVEVVQKLYAGPMNADGQALYPGHQAVGSELAWGQFVLGPAGMTPMAALIANGYLKYLRVPQEPAGVLFVLGLEVHPGGFRPAAP